MPYLFAASRINELFRMKQVFIIAIICNLFGAFAQQSIEVFGGVNLCGLHRRKATLNDDTSPPVINNIVGQNFGVMYHNRFHENVSFSVGLMSNSRGIERRFKLRHIAPGIDSTYVFFFKHHSFFLDVPIYIDFYENLGGNFYIFGGLGPYVGRNFMARNGGLKYGVATATAFNHEVGTDTHFFKDINPYRNPIWAFGFNFRAGFQIGKFSLSAAYSKDLLKYKSVMSGLFTENTQSKLRLWSVVFSLAYRFEFKK